MIIDSLPITVLFSLTLVCHGEGNGNPLQYSCLGNPTDRGVWQATVHGSQRVGHELAIKQPQQSQYG